MDLLSLASASHSAKTPARALRLERPPADLAQNYLVRVEPGSDELLLGKAF